jgi:serine/threonine protein phosphatase 1
MKTFAISDIHGCYDELMALYNKLPIKPGVDRMVFLGDYIDRGPKSRQVVQQLIDWKQQYPHWQMLYGNHEDLMLDALFYNGRVYNSFDLWYGQGGRQTYYSYLPDSLTRYERAISSVKDTIPQEHLVFLAGLPRFFEDEKYIYVHAGITPGKTPQETDPQELIWIRDPFLDSPYDWGKKVIHGHTPSQHLQPVLKNNRIGIDTAVCPNANNMLTAVELPREVFYQEPSHKKH